MTPQAAAAITQPEAKRTSFGQPLRALRTKETILEKRVRFALTELQIPFVQGPDFHVAQPDFFIEQLGLVIEVDGRYWHSSRKQLRRDRIKDNFYQSLGLSVLRINENETLDAKTAIMRGLLNLGLIQKGAAQKGAPA